MREEQTLRVAEFSPKVQTYWMLSGAIVCALMCLALIGFILLPLWLIFGTIITTKVRQSMSCELTDRSLKFSKGVLTKVEKTVPLEKITDLGLVQGPIMRHFGLYTLSIETAGQSGPGGALLRLTGIVDTPEFRKAVLAQRDRVVFEGGGRGGDTAAPQSTASVAASAESPQLVPLLTDIRDALGRIENQLKRHD